jgi:hypothetical protein
MRAATYTIPPAAGDTASAECVVYFLELDRAAIAASTEKPQISGRISPTNSYAPIISCCKQASLTMWIPVKHFLGVLTRAL